MSAAATRYRISIQYILVAALAVLLSWLLHEAAHWAAGRLLGYEMSMTLNKTYLVSGKYKSDADYQWVSAAGPLVTLLEASVIFVWMRRQRNYLLYPFLFACFYMRLFAAVISFRNPNDEARISKAVGIGTFTLPVLITVVLLILVYKTGTRYRFSTKFHLATAGLVIVFSSLLILGDQYHLFPPVINS